ncbi:MAG: AmmeMemoRadiSam system protein A [Bacteroidetes bacterium]|nr:AmmeMemoRadiSam system protein A [Bacteroidota bacterium]
MEKYFSDEDKKIMTALAKDAVERYVRTGKRASLSEAPASLKKNLACFVTLNYGGDLRGCIGTLEPEGTLYDSIIDNAISAASRDYRFAPVEEKELQGITYEVSVLSEPVPFAPSSADELLTGIKGKGVIIRKDLRSAVYLPQVWEHFTDSGDFLSSLCRKAGFSPNEWKDYRNMYFFVFNLMQ